LIERGGKGDGGGTCGGAGDGGRGTVCAEGWEEKAWWKGTS